MLNKIICILLSLLFMINLSVLNTSSEETDDVSPKTNLSPPVTLSNGNDTIESKVGDWRIYNVQTIQDKVIDLRGNLSIEYGGLLIFKNVTLRMNVTADNQYYRIDLYEGEFQLLENSLITDSPIDVDDGTGADPDFRYHMYLNWGTFTMKDSTIEESGPKYYESISAYGANIHIENSTIQQCYRGLYLSYCVNAVIKYNKFINMSDSGLIMYDNDNSKVVHNEFENTSYDAISTTYGRNNYILNNKINNTSVGISIRQEFYTRIENNTIENTDDGMNLNPYPNRKRIVVKNNIINHSQSSGIYTYRLYDSEITGNKINDSNYALYINYGEKVVVSDNEFTNTTYHAIYSYSSSDLTISKNIVNKTTSYSYAFYLYGSLWYRGFLIENNTFDIVRYGIYIGYHWEITIKNNNLTGVNYGYAIYTNYAKYVRFENNIIKNFDYGYYLYRSSNDAGDVTQIYGGYIKNSKYNDLRMYYQCYVNLYNVSLDLSKVYAYSGGYKIILNVYYNVDVFVRDINGPIGGVQVTVNESSGKDLTPITTPTDASGWARSISVLNMTKLWKSFVSVPLTTYFSPYNFSTNINGTVLYAQSEYVINKYRSITVNYSTDTPPTAPVNLRINVNISNIELFWESYVNDLQAYKIFRNNTVGGWDQIDVVKPPAPGFTKFYVDAEMASKLVEYRYMVHHVDLAGQEEMNNEWVIFTDWVITDYKKLENQSRMINGSLIIEFGGDLNLINTSINMNGTHYSPGIKNIEIRDGGKMIMRDFDGQKKSKGDGSFINASKTMGSYAFKVNPGGRLEIYNSLIHNSSTSVDAGVSNIYINSNDCIIKNNTIATTSRGIVLDGADDSVIDGNTFINVSKEYLQGVYILSSDNVIVANNTIINATGSSIEFKTSKGGLIYNNTIDVGGHQRLANFTDGYRGINLFYSEDILIENNSFNGTDVGVFLSYNSDLIIRENKLTNVTLLGVEAYDSTNVKFENNNIQVTGEFYTLGFNIGGMSITGSTLVEISNNTIENFTYADSESVGIRLQDFYSILLSQNDITDTKVGISIKNSFLHSIDDVIFYNNTIHDLMPGGIGMNILNTNNMIFLNNSIYNVTTAFHQLSTIDIYYDGNYIWDVIYGYSFKYGSTGSIFNATIYGLPENGVYLNSSSEVDLINPYFNQSLISISDKTCELRLHWFIEARIKDHFGNYRSGIFLRLRSVLGTILYESYTDNDGYIKNLIIMERVQYYDSSISLTPTSFEAEFANHKAFSAVKIDKIMQVDMQLENTPPQVYDILIDPYDPIQLVPKTTDVLTLNLSYKFVDSESDPENGTYYKWYRKIETEQNFAYIPQLDNLTTIPSNYTYKGDLWYCRVTPFDSLDYGTSGYSISVLIFNTKPVVSNITLSPENPQSSEGIFVNYSYFDIDNDEELGTTFYWYGNDGSGYTLRATTSRPQLGASFLNKGEIWYVEIEPKDGEDIGERVSSNIISVGNTQPSVTDVIIAPSNPTAKDNITVEYLFQDIDSDPEGASIINWMIIEADRKNIEFHESGFKNKTVEAIYLTKGDLWMCQVTPFDGTSYGVTVNSTIVKIGNTAPSVSNVRITPTSSKTSDNLSVTYDYYDSDNDLENETKFVWLKWESGNYVKTTLKGKTLPSIFTKKGDKWIVEITPFDGYDYGSPILSEPISIENSAPKIYEMKIMPDLPKTTNNLTASYTFSDENGDAESGTMIKWYKNGVYMPVLDNRTEISSTSTTKGDNWYFTVTPGDGSELGITYICPPIYIENTIPDFIFATISPISPFSNDELKAVFNLSDADGDEVNNFNIMWYKNGNYQEEFYNKLTIPVDATEKGQSWKYTISVSDDGYVYTETIESPSVFIKNSPPQITDFSPYETNITITETERIVFSIETNDIDGEQVAVKWFLNDLLKEDKNNYLFDTNYESMGNYLVEVTIQDYGAGSATVSRSWNVTVLNKNRAPKLTIGEPLSPNQVVNDDEPLKFIITYIDEDTNDINNVSWYLDDELVSTETTYTYRPSIKEFGDHEVLVVVKDQETGVTFKWNVTVKEKPKSTDEYLGLTWDQWSIVLEALVIGVTGLAAFVGFLKLRKRKGALQRYMRKIEDLMKTWQENPDKSESDLVELAENIESDFGQGKIEDFHFFLLDRQVKESLREIRQGKLKHGFASLPDKVRREMNVMLEDGRITDKEYKTFVGVITQSDEISKDEKIELRKLMRGWKDVDASEAGKKVKIKEIAVKRKKKLSRIDLKKLDWEDIGSEKESTDVKDDLGLPDIESDSTDDGLEDWDSDSDSDDGLDNWDDDSSDKNNDSSDFDDEEVF